MNIVEPNPNNDFQVIMLKPGATAKGEVSADGSAMIITITGLSSLIPENKEFADEWCEKLNGQPIHMDGKHHDNVVYWLSLYSKKLNCKVDLYVNDPPEFFDAEGKKIPLAQMTI